MQYLINKNVQRRPRFPATPSRPPSPREKVGNTITGMLSSQEGTKPGEDNRLCPSSPFSRVGVWRGLAHKPLKLIRNEPDAKCNCPKGGWPCQMVLSSPVTMAKGPWVLPSHPPHLEVGG